MRSHGEAVALGSVSSSQWYSILAVSSVGQVLPLATLTGGTECREYLISRGATKF